MYYARVARNSESHLGIWSSPHTRPEGLLKHQWCLLLLLLPHLIVDNMYFRTARCQVKLAKANPCQLFARDDLKRSSISNRAHLITSLSPPAQNLHPRFKLGSLCPGNSSNKSENWFRFIFPPSQVLVPIWEATMDNWQGANIQNPHNLGVVLIASRAFPGNNFVHWAIILSPCQPQWRVCVANKLAHTRPP